MAKKKKQLHTFYICSVISMPPCDRVHMELERMKCRVWLDHIISMKLMIPLFFAVLRTAICSNGLSAPDPLSMDPDLS